MPRDPRKFFDEFVKPAYEAWKRDELAEWKAKALISNLDIMAETYFRYWEHSDPSKISDATSPRKYREHLVAHEAEDFGLIWDVHDAHKHITLGSTRPGGRQVTQSEQTQPQSLRWGTARWGDGRWGSPEELVITTDGGEKRSLSSVAQHVLEMWERLLQ